MTIPDTAIEAAAEAILDHGRCGVPGECGFCGWNGDAPFHEHQARAAIEAAMPALREAIAQEIVSDGPKHPYNDDESTRINAWCGGLHFAARTVRGGAA